MKGQIALLLLVFDRRTLQLIVVAALTALNSDVLFIIY
jgi:hypothetical protein